MLVRIECGLLRDIHFLAVLLFALLVYLAVIDYLVFIGSGWGKEHEKIVTLLGSNFGSAARVDLSNGNMVNAHFRIVLVAPVLGEDSIEPFIVRRYEVAPLNDLQSLLLCRCPLGEEEVRSADSDRKRSGTRNLEKVSAGYSTLFRIHRQFLLYLTSLPQSSILDSIW